MNPMFTALGGLLLCSGASLAGTSSGVGVPNPVSAACGEHHGIGVTIDESVWGGAQGESCRLADDAIVDEGTLYDALTGGARSQAVERFLAAGWHTGPGAIETWGRQNCADLGGSVVDYREHLRPSSTLSMCRFPDRSAVEIWTLFAGPGYYPELAKLLRSQPAAADVAPRRAPPAGETVTVRRGDDVVVKLRSAGDGGYLWSVVSDGGLSPAVHTTILGASGRPGDFGFDVYTWSTAASAPGPYTLRLLDKRPFGSDPGIPYTVTVLITP